MKKGFWKNLLWVLIGYGIFAYAISSNWGTFKYLPGFVLIGSLGVFFLLGSLLHKEKLSVGALLGIFVPHCIANIFYIVGLNVKSETYIRIFREMVPQVYGSTDFISSLVPDSLLPSTKLTIATIIIIPLSYLCFVLGGRFRQSRKAGIKWLYNNIIVWSVHFILFVIITNIATVFPKILVEEQEKLIFAFISTILIFIVYFFLGKACLTIKNQLGQVTSILSVTITSSILYIGMLFLFINGGVFERYILPVATSFIGIICRKIGMMTGASGEYVSQYGVIATIIMIIAPTLLIYMGKFASMPDKKSHFR